MVSIADRPTDPLPDRLPDRPEIAVEFRDVSLQVQRRSLISHLNLAIQAGEALVLLGRSGSGKTTTLKLINHLLKASQGQVFVQGRSTQHWDVIQLRRRIGYVIQETGLFPHFTVGQNIALVPTLERWPQERITARIAELLRLVGLDTGFVDRYPHELSGGQRLSLIHI